MRRAIRRVEATEELLRHANIEEDSLEARIKSDFPLSTSYSMASAEPRTPEELKGDNLWGENARAGANSSPQESDVTDYSTIPAVAIPNRKNYDWYC